MSEISVRGLTKSFGKLTAVDGVSFDVHRGEIFGMLGPNGAGKSTLFRMLTTLLRPTDGTAVVAGADILTEADAVRRSIGVIPQAMTSDLELSVAENLIIFAKLYGVPRAQRQGQIDRLLDEVSLTEWADSPVKNLSGGMRRRAEIARALLHEPRVLFLDEPTAGLDPIARSAVWTLLLRMRAERNMTVLLTTHYMDEADRLCDRIAIVDHGQVKALASPLQLKAGMSTSVTLEVSFAGAPLGWEARLLDLPHVHDVRGDHQVVRISSSRGPDTTMALLQLAAADGVTVESLAVQAPTLDDVFVHHTGRQLRDALQAPSAADRSVMLRNG
jgi:ABC-2 type transport system ATP-binding protein